MTAGNQIFFFFLIFPGEAGWLTEKEDVSKRESEKRQLRCWMRGATAVDFFFSCFRVSVFEGVARNRDGDPVLLHDPGEH